MAKKKTGKVIQMLSPENYIRKKARTLPIYECMVNTDWEETKMVSLLVARKHTNGNITWCLYLVDLLCLGIKDTAYMFNASSFQYKEKLDTMEERMEIEAIDYDVAHNIIYSGIEYAEELGFKPHKDFTSITQFMLEEDTDEIELIEIECGHEGKPTYMRGPYDDESKARRIVAQLEKICGPGNYYHFDNYDEWKDAETPDSDTLEILIDEFYSLSEHLKELNEEDHKRLFELTNLLFEEMVDPDMADQDYDEISEIFDIEIDRTEIPDELLGFKHGDPRATPELKKRFLEIIRWSGKKKKKALKELNLFRQKAGDLPAVFFLELTICFEEDSAEHLKKMQEYADLFPDYPLLKLLWKSKQLMLNKINKDEILRLQFNLKEFFPERKSIHIMEYNHLIAFNIFTLSFLRNISKLKAFEMFLEDSVLNENEWGFFSSNLHILKMAFVFEFFDQ